MGQECYIGYSVEKIKCHDQGENQQLRAKSAFFENNILGDPIGFR